MIHDLMSISESVRYAAVYRDGAVEMTARDDLAGASSSESDRYEELIVNPTVLTVTRQRGEIDCGGLGYVVIRYGHFFQVVVPAPWGHASVAVELDGDPLAVARQVQAKLAGGS